MDQSGTPENITCLFCSKKYPIDTSFQHCTKCLVPFSMSAGEIEQLKARKQVKRGTSIITLSLVLFFSISLFAVFATLFNPHFHSNDFSSIIYLATVYLKSFIPIYLISLLGFVAGLSIRKRGRKKLFSTSNTQSETKP
ncbi:MAG: hypothetical protein ACFFD4_31080 [Candidatus Odinarchaeota archaeon]